MLPNEFFMLLVAGRTTAQVRDEPLSFRKLTPPGQGLEFHLDVFWAAAPLRIGKVGRENVPENQSMAN